MESQQIYLPLLILRSQITHEASDAIIHFFHKFFLFLFYLTIKIKKGLYFQGWKMKPKNSYWTKIKITTFNKTIKFNDKGLEDK